MYKATADRLPPFAACIIFPISLYLISAQMSNTADAQKQHRDAPLRTPGAAPAKYRTLFDCPRPLHAPLIFRFIVPHGCPPLPLKQLRLHHATNRTYAKAKALAAARAFSLN